MGELNFCTIHDVWKLAFEQLINDLSTDLGLPYLLTRAFHNKLFPFIYAFLRCYFLYFDLSQIVRFVPRILIPLAAFAFWEPRFRKALIAVQIVFPFIFIFNPAHWSLGARINLFSAYYICLGLLGGIKLLTKQRS